ncbi:hypothetical protein J437_LFUL004851 [Ladona fulva]|uniref:YqaJ viral recombinase domain-containing protein n=1 Tax=Ladona fulva TaxID=123851 RepID=A0A8K0NZC2_LADFU|nr:hypothetical protein J437_LFUL004851 [Ladona fulva]
MKNVHSGESLNLDDMSQQLERDVPSCSPQQSFNGSSDTRIALLQSKESGEEALRVTPAGLFIDEDKPYLAATPDGLIGEDGVVEIKCPYSLEKMSPAEGIASGRIKYCIMKDDERSGGRGV